MYFAINYLRQKVANNKFRSGCSLRFEDGFFGKVSRHLLKRLSARCRRRLILHQHNIYANWKQPCPRSKPPVLSQVNNTVQNVPEFYKMTWFGLIVSWPMLIHLVILIIGNWIRVSHTNIFGYAVQCSKALQRFVVRRGVQSSAYSGHVNICIFGCFNNYVTELGCLLPLIINVQLLVCSLFHFGGGLGFVICTCLPTFFYLLHLHMSPTKRLPFSKLNLNQLSSE